MHMYVWEIANKLLILWFKDGKMKIIIKLVYSDFNVIYIMLCVSIQTLGMGKNFHLLLEIVWKFWIFIMHPYKLRNTCCLRF